MTRGTIYFVTDKYILQTTEFNGDMYPDGHGNDVMSRLMVGVDSIKSFKKEVTEFNAGAHDYGTQLFYPTKREDLISSKNVVDMEDYFKLFFSDWTFWKNCSSKTITFKTRDGKKIKLLPNEQVAINFGREEGHFKECKLELKNS